MSRKNRSQAIDQAIKMSVELDTPVKRTPKVEREHSMAHLERETHRIRMMESQKVAKFSREEVVRRSNARPLRMVATTKKIPTMVVLETQYIPKVVETATLGRKAKVELVPTLVRKVVPVREFAGLGPWGW